MYRKSFRDIQLNISVPPSPSNDQSEGGGQPKPGKLQGLAQQPNEGMPTNGMDSSNLSYQKTKQKIEIQIIRNMVEKLVCEQGRKKIFGSTFYHKKKIAKDLTAGAEFRIPSDTYDLNREPVAFYFDFSGSCERHSSMFAQITSGLIAKGALTYIGGNGYTDFRIDKAPANCKASDIDKLLRNENVEGFKIHRYDDDLIEDIAKKENIKKIVIYTDYDADQNCIRLSEFTDTIWFCAQEPDEDEYDYTERNMERFKGKFFQAQSLEQIKMILSRLDDISFERLNRKRQLGLSK